VTRRAGMDRVHRQAASFIRRARKGVKIQCHR
jgi:hypothetical protein